MRSPARPGAGASGRSSGSPTTTRRTSSPSSGTGRGARPRARRDGSSPSRGRPRARVLSARRGGSRGSSPVLDTPAEQVLGYVTEARWFAGKGRLATLRSLTPLPWLNDTAEFFAGSAPAVRLEIAEVAYGAEQDPDDRSAEDPAWAGGPRQATAPDRRGPWEYYQLAHSYRSAPHPDLHSAEVARVDHSELGSVVVYDA